MTAVSFRSSHVTGDFACGRLSVRVEREEADTGQTIYDEIWFEVPADFHTHNDAVAAALLTLVARSCTHVRFNFSISDYCARTLAEHYALDDMGPVNPGLEPRRPGNLLGLNFSGGLDSLAVWLLLREYGGVEFRTISSLYGDPYTFEERGIRSIPVDVVCRTNFRSLHYGLGGRFNAAMPLLFAEYLGLGSLTSGHTYNQSPYSIEHLFHGEEPRFRDLERAYHAGGLSEAHLIRGLNSLGTSQIVFTLAPELIEASFAASAPPGWENHITKGFALRWLYERADCALPPFVRDLSFPESPPRFGVGLGAEMRTLFIVKHYGLDVARHVMRGLEAYDLSFVDDLSFEFLGKYNPNYVGLMPDDVRVPILRGLHACGIYPYTERDWYELDTVNAFLLSIATDRSAREMAALRRQQMADRLQSGS